jgi:hypothetical protein
MQKVVGSNPISRLPDRAGVPQVKPGALAEWLRSGLQSRLHRFDSGRRLAFRLLALGTGSGCRPYDGTRVEAVFRRPQSTN